MWDYVSPESIKGAERLLRRIDDITHMLAGNPDAGRISPVLSEIRYFPFENYLLFYRATKTTLVVLRILHAARDVTPGLLSE